MIEVKPLGTESDSVPKIYKRRGYHVIYKSRPCNAVLNGSWFWIYHKNRVIEKIFANMITVCQKSTVSALYEIEGISKVVLPKNHLKVETKELVNRPQKKGYGLPTFHYGLMK